MGFVQLLVVTAAADQTGRTISLLVAGLVGIAVALAALTVWYWRHTDPRRQARSRPRLEQQPVEIIEFRQQQVGRVDDIESGLSLPEGVSAGAPRPIVASIPQSLTSPPVSPPLSNRLDPDVVETGRAGTREWVDPDVWVDAFASEPEATTSHPGPERPPLVPETALPWFEVDLEPQPVSADSDLRRDPVERPMYPTEPEPQPTRPESRPAGHSLSDADWDVITQAALVTFAETELPNSVDMTDQSSVR